LNIHKFDAKTPINHFQLRKELGCTSIYVNGDDLIIAGDLTYQQAAEGLANHKPEPYAEPTVADKLASVGLNLDDLKEALGL